MDRLSALETMRARRLVMRQRQAEQRLRNRQASVSTNAMTVAATNIATPTVGASAPLQMVA